MVTTVISFQHLHSLPPNEQLQMMRRSVTVDRTTKWGNPFRIGYNVSTRQEAIDKYRVYLKQRPDLIEAARQELRGKVLACWCKPSPCHGDILAAVADGADP